MEDLPIDISEDDEDFLINYLFFTPFQYEMRPGFREIEEYEDIDVFSSRNRKHPLKVYVNDFGIPYYVNTGKSVLQTTHKKSGIFVLDIYENLYMVSKSYHHSDILSSENVACAGQYTLNRKGQIKQIDNKSGHYTPDFSCLELVVDIIRENGYDGEIKITIYE